MDNNLGNNFKKKLLIQAIILGAGVFLLALLIILLNADINKRAEKIVQYKRELEIRNQTIALLTNSNADFERAQPMETVLSDLLPSKDQLINFPKELDTLARGYSIQIGFSFGTENASTETDPGLIRYTMALTGFYQDIVDFLKELEGHPYFITMDSIDVKLITGTTYSLITSGTIFTK